MTELAQLAPAKACTKCGITKPLDKFYLVSGRRQSRCKDCDNAQRRHRDHIRYTGVSDITPEQELAMRKRTRKCSLCAVYMTNKPGLPNSKHLDHILPLILGGTHTHGNVRIICRSCNLKRPKDGSDVAQVTLWAQGPAVVSRPDGRKDGGNANKTTCRKGLHPWVPANIMITASGKKLCKACHEAKERKQSPRHTCKCGAEFAAPGRTFMCPDCAMAVARKAAELHAGGLTWTQVAVEVGYESGTGAMDAAKRTGYVPAPRPSKPPVPKPQRACPDCGTPKQPGSRQCEPCTTARAWLAVELHEGGASLREICTKIGYSSPTGVSNLMASVTTTSMRRGRPRKVSNLDAGNCARKL